ncbi:hypothetical protein HNP46_000272 [Pseudomonas nitritireducens]|uniref:Uncharacterized protein n=1 Tax=Pseudomonas nitroreducens TaxID=46680 RepID=A0A7W7KEP3_PSENT|nr:hypothetical protein [Pseudomonas nitritireducens]MBB4861461.1 hypothetical protein [Pseudomonas nitritireducens]
MNILNPYRTGTLYYTNFNAFVAQYKDATEAQMLKANEKVVKAQGNYLNLTDAQASALAFERDCLATIFLAKFGRSINASKPA